LLLLVYLLIRNQLLVHYGHLGLHRLLGDIGFRALPLKLIDFGSELFDLLFLLGVVTLIDLFFTSQLHHFFFKAVLDLLNLLHLQRKVRQTRSQLLILVPAHLEFDLVLLELLAKLPVLLSGLLRLELLLQQIAAQHLYLGIEFGMGVSELLLLHHVSVDL